MTAYNRPEFFISTIESINKCDELENVPIFFYLDGGKNSRQNENIELIKKVKHKNKFVIKRGYNYGCNKNVLGGFDDLFIELKFDQVFYLEDDYRFGNGFFKYCYSTLQKIKNEIDPSVGIFQGFGYCLLTTEEKKQHLDEVKHVDECYMWGYTLEKDFYLQLREKLEGFYQINSTLATDGTAMQSMISKKVEYANFFDSLIEANRDRMSERLIRQYYKKQFEHCSLTYDAAFDLGMAALGKKRYTPVVNRMSNVGTYGAHFGTEFFKSLKLDQIKFEEVW